MLEADANLEDAFEKLKEINLENQQMFAVERDEYGEIVEDIGYIMTDYFDHYGNNDKLIFRKVNGKRAEHEFNIELFDGVVWNGIIDALGKEGPLNWVVDHKSFNRMQNEDARWRNVQGATYTRAVDILGWPSVSGMLWNMVRSKPPARIQVLKNDTLSVKEIDSLPSVLDAFLKEHPEHKSQPTLVGFRKSLEANRSKYFQRIRTPTSKSVVDAVFSDFVETAKEIVDNHGKKKTRNIGQHCSWCDYEPICRALMQGSDWEFVIKKEYRLSEKASEDREAEPESE